MVECDIRDISSWLLPWGSSLAGGTSLRPRFPQVTCTGLCMLSPSSPSGGNHQSAEVWRAPAAGAACSMTFKAWGFPAGSYILHELSGAERRRGELCNSGSPRQLQVTAGLIHGPSFPWMQARKRLSCLFHPSSPSSLIASVHMSPLCQTLAK